MKGWWIMKLLKFEDSQKFENSDKCIVIEYPLGDKDINFSTAVLTGRYPNEGYCVNEECKELIYVIYRLKNYIIQKSINIIKINYPIK